MSSDGLIDQYMDTAEYQKELQLILINLINNYKNNDIIELINNLNKCQNLN